MGCGLMRRSFLMVLGIFPRHQWRTRASRRTAWPSLSTVSPQEATDEVSDPEYHGLDRTRHEKNRLGLAMP